MTLTSDASAQAAPPVEDPPQIPATPTSGDPRRLAVLAGVTAGGLGLGLGELTAGALAPNGSPVTAVSEGILSLLPGPLINFGKDFLGHADKPILMLLVLVGALALAGLAGRLGAIRLSIGTAVVTALSVISVVAVVSAADFQMLNLVPSLVGWVAGMIALRGLLMLAEDHRLAAGARTASPGLPASRRAFLTATGATGAAALLTGAGGRVLTNQTTSGASSPSAFTLPTPAVPAPAVPAGANFDLPGISSYITPNDQFYRIDTAFIVPRPRVPDWSLTIGGNVTTPVRLTMDDVLGRTLEEHYITLTCVSNEVGGNLIGNARWLGIRLDKLLTEAGPKPGTDMVLSSSSDGFSAGTPLDVLLDPKRPCLLAIGMNGQPLPSEHGFPARLVVPGLYGYVSATKWVTNLKVTSFADDQGYWTPLGWSAKGPIKLASRIDTPRKTVGAGQIFIGGVAWSQHVGISKVQVRIDTEDWRDAELADTTGPDTWRLWRFGYDASPGRHTATVRAVDANQMVQSEQQAPPAPDGSSGLHSISIDVR